ncbi:MAG: hypothetical protein ACI9UJ_001166 [bacterium]|jgi:hypothetical protein
MKKILEKVGAIFLSTVSFFGISLFGLLIYFTMNSTLGLIITIVIGLLALYTAWSIFKVINDRGILEFFTASRATPSLDNLKGSINSDFKKWDKAAYVDNFNQNRSVFKGGNIQIWGDWKERDLEEDNRIDAVEITNDKLVFTFINGNKLLISNPKNIIESNTYLKILSADKVRWEWSSKENKQFNYYKYEFLNNKIHTSTDSQWSESYFDVLKGKPAIAILGVQ